jgi:hypothetical protein
MRRVSLFTALGILTVAATTFAAPVKAREAWAAGRIARVDTAAKSVVVKQGTHEMTFVLAPDARVTQGKTVLQAADLANEVGHQVKVRFTMNAAAKVADRIQVTAATPRAANALAKK